MTRLEQIEALDPEERVVYICTGCASLFPELMAEGVYDLECPNCLQPLQLDD